MKGQAQACSSRLRSQPAASLTLTPEPGTRYCDPCYQGERGFALMSQRWRALQHVMLSPSAIGDIAKSVLVLVRFEHKVIS
jgi:hypothetical protein